IGSENDALNHCTGYLPREDEDGGHNQVEQEINDKEPFDRLLGDGLRQGHVFEPAGEVEVVDQDQDKNSFDRKDDAPLHHPQPHGHLFRWRRRFFQQVAQLLEGWPAQVLHYFGLQWFYLVRRRIASWCSGTTARPRPAATPPWLPRAPVPEISVCNAMVSLIRAAGESLQLSLA